MRHLILSLSIIFSLSACGSPRSDPFAVGDDASTPMDSPSACAAVEGLGCPCGAVFGRWRCVGDQPVCVCPMPAFDAGTIRPDVMRETTDVMRDPPDAAIPFPCMIGSLYCASVRACVDISLNRAHCGACDRACASDASCVRGACARPDAGAPVDGGTVRDELNRPVMRSSISILYAFVCPSCGGDPPVERPSSGWTCAYSARTDTLSFSVPTEYVSRPQTISAAIHLDPSESRSLSLMDLDGARTYMDRVEVFAGTPYQSDRRRQGFHVQIATPRMGVAVGIGGVPGRTFAPDLGDIWLFGCEVN